ncbi:MAG TPA: hypothetical protein PKW33_17445 [Anaerolineaceae bacterium]|nr:hypothetical protein [Anaerolineaceae bacterium]HPN53386.1 hypothetical protein [Anaerolineaceae bacterium]
MKASELKTQITLGWLALAGGLLLLAAGSLLRLWMPGLALDPRLIAAAGIILFGVGIGQLAKYMIIKKYPKDTRQIVIEEQDERAQTIRLHAASLAFRVTVVAAVAALLLTVFNNLLNPASTALNADLLWPYQVAMVVVPMLAYIGGLAWYSSRF